MRNIQLWVDAARMRAAKFGVVWVVVSLSGLSAGCDSESNLFWVNPCAEGDTQSCAIPIGACEGTQRCEVVSNCRSDDPSCEKRTDWGECRNSQIGQACGEDRGTCRAGTYVCWSREVVCGNGFVGPSPERCDGKDNDCDGYEDEPVEVSQDPSFRLELRVDEQGYCYGGPPETRGVGECRAGVPMCQQGYGENASPVCVGEVLPQPKNCSNQRDNDCDGVIDRPGEDVVEPIDLVLMIDRSGSMVDYYQPIQQGIAAFSQEVLATHPEALTRIRVAVAQMPSEVGERCTVVRPAAVPEFLASGEAQAFDANDAFMTLDQASRVVSSWGNTPGSGTEPTWDCPYMVGHPKNPLRLDYRSGSQRVLVSFTDENGQTYPGIWPVQPSLPVSEGLVIATLLPNAETSQTHQYNSFDMPGVAADYDDIVTATGGSHFTLSRDYLRVQADLVSLLRRVSCL